MRPTVLAVLCGLGATTTAYAGAILELIPDRPGPYAPGQRVVVDFLLRHDAPEPVLVDSIRLDFAASDLRLALDASFVFDHSHNPDQWGIHEQAALPRPAYSFAIDVLCACGVAELYPGQSVLIGSLGVQVPAGAGVYSLDAMNAGDPDLHHGEFLELGFYPPEFPYPGAPYWRAFSGDLVGGRMDLVVIPEPGALGLFALAATLGSLRPGRLIDARRRAAAGRPASHPERTSRNSPQRRHRPPAALPEAPCEKPLRLGIERVG